MVVPLAAAHFFRPVMDQDVIAATRLRYQIPDVQYLLCLAAPGPQKNLAPLMRAAQFSWKRCAEMTADVYHFAAGQG